MAPSFFLLFWCVVEIVSYGLSLLLIAILFWPRTLSRAEDRQAPATEEQLGGCPCQSRSGHARRAGMAGSAGAWLRLSLPHRSSATLSISSSSAWRVPARRAGDEGHNADRDR